MRRASDCTIIVSAGAVPAKARNCTGRAVDGEIGRDDARARVLADDGGFLIELAGEAVNAIDQRVGLVACAQGMLLGKKLGTLL